MFSTTNTFMLFMEAKETIDDELGLRCQYSSDNSG